MQEVVDMEFETKFRDVYDSENEQHCVAVEFFVWADTYEQAYNKLEWALKRVEFDSAIERSGYE
jgi:hypothetical protein